MKAVHIQESDLKHSNATCFWVDSESLGFYQVAIPQVPKRRWQQVLPWALDEISLESPEKMHIVFGDVDKENGRLPVIAVPHEQMQWWNEQVGEQKIEASAFCPDVLALPLNESGWSIWQQSEQRCLVRTGKLSGFVAHPQWLRQLLETLDKVPAQSSQIDHQQTNDENGSSDDRKSGSSKDENSKDESGESDNRHIKRGSSEATEVSIDITDLQSKEIEHKSLASQKPDSVINYVLTDGSGFACQLSNIVVQQQTISEQGFPFHHAQVVPAINLLQGQYKPAFDLKKKIQRSVNVTALLSGVLVFLVWMLIVVDIFQIRSDKQKLERQMIQQWQSFLNVRHDPRLSIPQWLQLIEKQLAQISESRQQSPWLMLVFLDSVLSNCAGQCQIETLGIESGELNLILTGQQPKLTLLQQQLNSKPLQGYRIHWNKIGAAGDKVSIKLKTIKSDGSAPPTAVASPTSGR